MIGLQNLPAEIDQNMHELRSMDEEFQRKRLLYNGLWAERYL